MRAIGPVTLAVLLWAALLTLGACAAGQAASTGQGTTFTIGHQSFQKVWRAALAAFTKNLNITKLDRARGTIVGTRPQWGWGQRVTLVIRPTTPQSPVYTLKVLSTVRGDPATDWEVFIASEIRDAL